MKIHPTRRVRHAARVRRPGVAVVELAVLLPLLVFLFVIGIDFARLFYHLVTVTAAARNGATYGSMEPKNSTDTEGIKKAALADAQNLVPAPKVFSSTATDELGHPCVNVTVSWTFNTVSRFPLVPSTVNLSRTVQMRIAPLEPKEPVYATTP
jgi:Flp pilus assembly protein TadG